jgi:hypothetical protein
MAQKYLSVERKICAMTKQKYFNDEHGIGVNMMEHYLNDGHRICAKMAQKYLSDEQKIMQKIKMDSRQVGLEGLDWIALAQTRNRLRALVNAVINLRFS